MANEHFSSNKDLQDLLNVLNDFTLTVLSPIPNNSSLLSLWYKFKPLLAADSFDPLKLQSFISNIDYELAQPSVRKPPLSAKYPSEATSEPLRDISQLPQTGITSRGDSFYSNEINKKSGNNSTSQTSNSGGNFNFQNSMDNLPDLSIKNDLQYYHSKSDKVDLKSVTNQSLEAQTFRKDARGNLAKETNTTRPQYSNPDQSLDLEETRRVSKKYEASLEVLGKIASEGKQEAILKVNPMVQRSGDDSHPDPPTPPNDRMSLESNDANKEIHCPRALDFLSKVLNKPYSTISNHVIYAKLFVFEAKMTKNTFYNSLVITYFLSLLSDRSTSLALSNLYEKIVIRKVKLNHYPNHEKLHESLTSSLKAIIKEKIAKPGQTKILQELFFTKFSQDEYFRLGLVAVMKELLIDYAAGRDKRTFENLFRDTTLEKLAQTIRTGSDEPTEEMIAAFPYIVEGNIEVHYIKAQKIEIVLYNQKGAKNFKQTLFSLICSQVNTNSTTFQALVNKDQAELFEKFDINPSPEELQEVPELQDTVYMSLDSIDDSKENHIEDKILEKETKQVKKPTPRKLPNNKIPVLNRDFLLTKIQDLTQFMNKHTDKISDLFNPQSKTSPPANANPGNQPQTIRYAVPTTINNIQDNPTARQHPTNKNQAGFPEAIKENPNSVRQNPPSINNPPVKNAKPLAYKDTSYKINVPINPLPGNNNQHAESSRPSLAYYTGPISATMDNKAGTARAYVGNNQAHNTSVLNNTLNVTLNNSLNNTPKRESKNTLEVEKENKDIASLNMRSPLKRIVVYSHQKEAAFAGVEKEVHLLEEVIKKSPKLANGPDKLIYEDAAI